MFKKNEKYEDKKGILKCDYRRFSSCKICTIDTANSQVYIKKRREDSIIYLLNSYLDLNFDVVSAATKNIYADGVLM